MASGITIQGQGYIGNIYTSDALVNQGTITSEPVDNTAAYNGINGNLDNEGTLILDNSTFVANGAAQYGGDFGGAISSGGTLTVTNSIFYDNYSSAGGAGIQNFGTANARYNVFYANVNEFSIEDDCDSCTTNTNAVYADPLLTSLGYHGGPNPNRFPLPGSSAICSGSTSLIPAGLTTDQRGLPRTTTYGSTACIDAGSVQTDYLSVRFTNLPAQGYYSGIADTPVTPAPIVAVTEKGWIVGSEPIILTFSGIGGASGLGPVTSLAGIGATFTGLSVRSPGDNDTVSVNLPITAPANPLQPPPLTATAHLKIGMNSASPPFGSLDSVEDSVTMSTVVGSSDMVEVTGWVADEADGAPLSNVKVYIDGTLAGTPTLGIPRYGVAVDYKNPAYLNSGYQFLHSAASLSLGTHAVTVIAIDSGGNSRTLGPVIFTVAATAGLSPPFGSLAYVEDSVTFSNTVGQSHSVDVRGWVADPADGSPLSNVKVYIDGALAGTPTLGIATPNVVTRYSNPAYAHAGFELLYSGSSLWLGTHEVTIVAIDSGGRSITLGPVSFTLAELAGLGAPFGGIAFAGDSTTQTTTVSPSHSLEVEGWVADAADGSPLSNVGVYIDDVLAGAPTLGIASPTVATMYGNPAYGHAKYQFLYPAASLATGAHWVTVIAVDSGGRSTTFGPNIFTVE